MKKIFTLSFLLAMICVKGWGQNVSVTATAGTTGPTLYATLNAAFAAINAGTHQGAITINISANTTEPATGAVLNSSGAGSANYTSVLIQPSNDGVSVSGATTTGLGVITLNGADNVTINGDNPNTTGTNRNLTIVNTATNTVAYNSVVRIATGTGIGYISADNNTIKNSIIIGNATARNASGNTSTTGTENASFGIYAGGNGGATVTAVSSVTTTTATSGTTINTLLIDNNAVNSCARGIVFNTAATTVSTGVTITNNLIGDQSTTLSGTPPYTTPTTTVYTKAIYVAGTNAVTITGNTIKNIISYVSTQTSGIELNSLIGTNGVTITSNTINGVVCNTTSSAFGIIVSASASNPTVSGNIVSNVQEVGAGTTSIAGIQITHSGTSALVEKNKVSTVYNRSTGGYASYGINIAAGSAYTIQNNFIWDINAYVANSALSTTYNIFGLRIVAGTNHKIYHNSINLYGAVLTGSTIASNSALVIVSSASTGMDIRNNIFSNTMTGMVSGSSTSCIMIPSGLTNTFNLTLNNNAYYQGAGTGAEIGQAGTSGVSGYVASGFNAGSTTGTTNLRTYTSTLSTAGTNDNASFASTTAAPFTSSTDLHIPNGTTTQLESGGASLGVTTDIDGDTRNATTPDIGADEFNGNPLDLTPPTITYTVLSNTCTTGARTLVATITDASGVPTAGSGLPVLYWRIGTSGAFTAAAAAYTGSNQYQFTFGGTAVAGNTIQYYIAAQDNASTPNVTTNPSAGASGFTANPPAASTPTNAPNSYTINSTLSGTYNVGTGQTYTTLTAAVNAYNNSCLGGAVTFLLTDANYSSAETFPIAINANVNASSTNTLTIKPNTGVTTTITGSVASGALLKLNGANYIIIDGSNTVNGTTKNLTITNTNTTSPTAISLVSLGIGLGAANNTIKNCNISTGIYAGACYGISIGGSTPGTSGADNDNNTVQNNAITVATIGVYATGTTSVSAGGDDNLTISGNSMTVSSSSSTTIYGIEVGYSLNSSITGNTVSSTTSGGGQPVGISLETGFVSSTVTKNFIAGVTTTATGGYGSRGITAGTGSTTSALTIANNVIYGVNGSNYSSFSISSSMGIGIGMIGGSSTISTTCGGVNLYYNSINMYGNHSYTSATNTAALYVGSGASALDIRDNIFVNSLNNTGASGSYDYGIYSAAAASAFSTLNYNDYYGVSSANSTFIVGYISSANQTTLSAWQTATGKEANGKNADPQFVSSTNLQPITGSPVVAAGTPISGITTDIIGNTRSASTPTIGAYETPASVVVINSISINPTGSQCTATARTVTANTTAGGTNIATVILNYSFNGVAQSPVTMTGGTATGTSTWTGTIPVATPVNATVTWSVTATDGITSRTTAGTSYQDAALTGSTATAAASPNPVCAGSAITLTGTFVRSGTATIGSGTDVTTLSTDGTPYRVGNTVGYQFKNQYLWKASELQAAGLKAGNITAVTLNVVGAGGGTLSNLTVKMGTTALTAMTTTYVTGLTAVLSLATYPSSGTLTTGPQNHTFTTSFNWDGTSNLVLEICAQLATSGSAGTLSGDATSFVSTIANNPSTTACSGTTGGGTYSVRPNIIFAGNVSPTFSSYSWKDETSTAVGTTNPLTITPSATHTYTITATDANNCTLTSPGVSVTVNPLPTAPTGTNSTQCGTQIPTASVADPNGYTTPTFKWYADNVTTTALQSSTSATYTSTVSVTTTFYVSVTNPSTGCESPRTAVTVSVVTPDAVTAGASPTSVCIGTGTSLSATQTGNTNVYTYTWTCTSSNASTSGISSSVTGNPVTVTPTATGTYTYLVTAYDGSTNCTTTSSINVMVNALPASPTIIATATRICLGTAVTLAASSGSGSYCTPAYTSYDGNDYIAKVELLNSTGATTLFSRTSGATSLPGYDNETALNTTTLTAGTTYTLRVTIFNGGFSENVAAFLDYNADYSFGGTNETLLTSTTLTTGANTGLISFTVPAGAYNGSARLRFVLSFSNTATSCMSTGYGETEDYTVTIAGGVTNPNAVSYLWNPGGATTSSITVNPTATTSYTVTATNGNNCNATSAPTTITIVSPLAGVYSVGSTNIGGEAGHYSTLTAAVADYNNLCIGGAVTFALTDATYSTAETFPITINGVSSASSTNTLTIKPNTGVTSTIIGSITTSIIKLNGADYVTIDGSNSGGATRNLTITNSNNGTSSAVIWLASASSTDGATNNTIKNIIANGNASTTTLSDIVSSSGITIGNPAEAANTNNTYQNDSLLTAQYGIGVVGPSTMETGTVISNNSIGSGSTNIGFRGIFISNEQNISATGNNIIGISSTNSSSTSPSGGIIVAGAASGGSIDKNKITNIKNTNTGGYASYGIALETSTTSTGLTVSNNFISDVAGYGYSSSVVDNGFGIVAATGGGYNIYFNSVSLGTNQTASGYSTDLYVESGITGLDVRNNIFSNTQTTGNVYNVYDAGTNSAFTNINYNDYYYNTANAWTGYLSSNRTALSDWQTATGKDANSLSIQPIFVSATDLHLTTCNPALDGKGVSIAAVIKDIDGDTRQSPPDIGADEFTSINALASISANPTSATICVGGSVILTENGGTATSWSWNTGATSSSISVSPSVNTTYTVSATTSGCTITASKIITVNPLPAAATISPSATVSVCYNSVQQLTANAAANGTLFSENFNTTTVGSLPTGWTSGVASGSATYWGAVNSSKAGGIANEIRYYGLSAPSSETGTYYLQGPVSNASTWNSLKLSFNYYLTNYDATTYPYSLNLQTSTDGSTWTNKSTITPTGSSNITANTVNVDLSGLGSPSTLYFRFVLIGQPYGMDYWYIDNVSITGLQNSTSITWSPTTDLYTDMAATNAYTGGNAATVYAKPTANRTYTVTNSNGTCSNSTTAAVTISSSPTWTGNVSTDWNISGNWCNNSVPTATSNVVIPSGTPNQPIIYQTSDAAVASLTISSGATLSVSNGYNITIGSGGSFTNNGTFTTTSTGAVVFSGTGTVNGSSATTFKNLTINGALTVTTSPTITGNFQINGNTSTVSAAPTYTSTSSLIYNPGSGNTFTTGNEWNAGAASTIAVGLGIPQNVTIQSGTVNIPTTGGTADRALVGDLTIASGTTFGLSTTSNHDLYILGNWINNGGTLVPNARKVQFNATSGIQTISGTTTFYDLNLANSVSLTTSLITISNSLSNSTGTMDGGTSTVTFTGTGATPSMIGGNAKNFYNLQINSGANITHTTGGGNIHLANSFVNNGSLTEKASYNFYFDKSGGSETMSGTGSTKFGNIAIGSSSLGFSTSVNTGTSKFTVSGDSIYFRTNGSSLTSTGVVTINKDTTKTFFIKNSNGVTTSGTATFFDLNIDSANGISAVATPVDFGSGITNITDSLIINPGGSAITNAPIYASGASLAYNTKIAAYTTGTEWSSNAITPGTGSPKNVIIKNTNSVLLAGDRGLSGNLNILIASDTLDLNNHTLTINGAISSTGFLSGSATSGLIIGGAAGTTHFRTGGTNNTLQTLTTNSAGSVTLGDSLYMTAGAIPGTVTANGTINTGNFLVLRSDGYGTAAVGPSNGTISGNVTVHRFITSHKAWRFLSAPINNSETIHQAWQENQGANAPTPVGYGTQITSDTSAWSTLGFDRQSLYPGMKYYNNATDTYTGIPTTNAPFDHSKQGYLLFVRGDRTATTATSPASSTTLRLIGPLYQGTQTAVPIYPTGFTPVANPFAAPVDLSKLDPSHSLFFYVYDPNLGTSYGAFHTLTWNGSSYQPTPAGGSYLLSPPAIPGLIQSGEAFWAAPGSATSVTFSESVKSTAYAGAAIFRPERPAGKDEHIITNLYSITGSGNVLVDGVLHQIDDAYSNAVDNMDAKKLNNFNENLAILTGGKLISVERRHTLTGNDTLFYSISGLKAQQYLASIDMQGITEVAEGFLIDKYLQTQTTLNLSGNTAINFTVDANAGSYASDRFMIVFSPLRVLPVTFTTIKAYKQDKNIDVEWRVSNENNIREYQVEKSVNGKDFTALAAVKPSNNNGGSAVYVQTDSRPVAGDNYYRIRSVDMTGAISYTMIVKVAIGEQHQEITIHPNPITDGQIHLQFSNEPSGKYGLRLLNSLGQIIMEKQITRTDSDGTELIGWDYNLAHGMYKLEVTKPDGAIKIINVLY